MRIEKTNLNKRKQILKNENVPENFDRNEINVSDLNNYSLGMSNGGCSKNW